MPESQKPKELQKMEAEKLIGRLLQLFKASGLVVFWLMGNSFTFQASEASNGIS
jgi:hypothetical protein